MTLQTIITALGLTLAAGMATGIGALIAFFCRHTNTRLLSFAMGLSAGVMVYISFMELLPEAIINAGSSFYGLQPKIGVTLAFFAGIGIIALIDWLIPNAENPHEAASVEDMEMLPNRSHAAHTGIVVAVVIAIHNFPEGIATFISATDGMEIALPIAFAIAIHNIPEGIAVSVPVYYATGNRRKALLMAMLSGLSEPIGALAALFLIMPWWSAQLNALLLAVVAGIMVYISFDELLPSAERYGHHHLSIIGVIAGMGIMALSLLLL